MKTSLWIVICAFVGICAFFFRKEIADAFSPSVLEISLTASPEESLLVVSMQAKIIETKKLEGKETSEVIIQWRCKVQNKGSKPVRYRLAIEFCDRDGFTLLRTTYDSNDTVGDLRGMAEHEAFQDVTTDILRAKRFAKAKVSALPYKTNAQIELEQVQEEVKRRAELAENAEKMVAAQQEAEKAQRLELERFAIEEKARQAALSDERQRQWAADQTKQAESQRQLAIQAEARAQARRVEVAKWRKLKLGMTVSEVTAILGEPTSKSDNYHWSYPSLPGSFESLSVNFDYAGGWYLHGWTGPSDP